MACLPWCEITIDGASTGKRSPLKSFAIAAGTHTVSVTNPPTGLEASKKVTVEAGKPARVTFRLQ